MSEMPNSWFVLRADAEAFLLDLIGCAELATVDLDHLEGNLYYMRLGRAARRAQIYLKANSLDRSALSFIALHRELLRDRPTGPESSSLPDHMFTSAKELEDNFLDAASGLPLSVEAAAPFNELIASLLKAMKEVGYEEIDRKTGEVEANHAIDPIQCFGVGRKLAYLEEHLSEKNYGRALEIVEEDLPEWLEHKCPEYLKSIDYALRNAISGITNLQKQEDGY
ncbi:hypothetical protein [Methylobacterium sp. Leaf469]|uniref:hypothetical protein n=1 Tax=Methylobacterium sp. Leaf469 TaxID=1736387 RepID=UPI000ABC9675|nr:hypothetical protein [Methylobacterium sp. Leaf469]